MNNKPRKDRLLPEDVCPSLMTKTKTLNTHYRRSIQEHYFTADTALFYCMQTMNEHGPDDQECFPDNCRPGRGCWCGDVT